MTRKLKGAVAITTVALIAAWAKRKWGQRSPAIETGEYEDYLADIIQRARPALERAYGLESS